MNMEEWMNEWKRRMAFDKVWMWRRFGCADGTGVLAFMKIKKKVRGFVVYGHPQGF
jgi:hypothetical protein